MTPTAHNEIRMEEKVVYTTVHERTVRPTEDALNA